MAARELRAAAALAAAALLLALPPATRAQAGEWAMEGGVAASTGRPATVAAIALSIRSRAIQDSRCYLMNGGAVESFYISEDTPVGSIIGTLSVNGDPSSEGDITLRVQERGAGVEVAAGSKNVTLLRALDREERRGPAALYVNVRCDRRRTADPSFVIPVSVRVWDVNDNAPAWVGAPYRVRLSELTAVGSRVLPALRAADADQPGPHSTVRYEVLPGPHSEYFGFANELDSVLVVKKPLDYETLSNFTIGLRAQDQGTPPLHNDTTLYVEVLDADDQNPKFTHDHYTAVIPEDAKVGTILETSPGPISAVDQDVGINAPLYYEATGDTRHLVAVDRDSGRVAVTDSLLAEGHLPVTVVIKATQVDNPDRYALATLSARRAHAAPTPHAGVRFARREYAAKVREDAPPGAALLTLHTAPDRGPAHSPLQFYVSDRSFLEKFAINSAGEVLLRRPLDYETTTEYRYQVMVTDGVANDTASINITVLNVNEWEPRFRYPQYSFLVEEAEPGAGLLRVGALDVHDGDAPDAVSLHLSGDHASLFYLSGTGELFLRAEGLAALNSSQLRLVATATDSGTPPKQTSVPVTVQVSERLLSSRGSARSASVLGAFAAALALLALLVCALLAYIYRVRRRVKQSSSPSPSKPALAAVAQERPRSRSPAAVATFPVAAAAGPAASGSLQSVSAGASTILANSTSSLNLPHDAQRTTPSRQSARLAAKSGGGAEAREAQMSDHLAGGDAGAGRSGVAWPAATIPARVKKLSWDERDHTDTLQGSKHREPAHDATNHTVADHMNLTVYF